MNFRKAFYVFIIGISLVEAGCSFGGPEAQPTPTAVPPNYQPLATEICLVWIDELVNKGTLPYGVGSEKRVETCIEELTLTANGSGWPSDKSYDPSTGQDVSRAMLTAISIGGQIGVPAAATEALAKSISQAELP